MKTRLSTLAASLTLAEWGGIFVYFYVSGRISSFLHPYFQPWVLAAGVLMVLSGGVIFFTQDGDCGHGHGPGGCCGHDDGAEEWNWQKWARAFILLLPMAAAALFSPDRFGEVLFQNRKAITTAAELPGSFKPDQPSADQHAPAGNPASVPSGNSPEEKPAEPEAAELVSIMDLIYSAGVASERDQMEGKTIAVIGQLARDRVKGLGSGDFGVYELVIMCCAADARPVSIRVAYPDLSPALKNTDWVRVTGKVRFQRVGESAVPILEAVSVSESPPPDDPYLTP